jgi:hypothetical protein
MSTAWFESLALQRPIVAALASIACSAGACTSNQTTINSNCGVGTHLQDGECVPDEDGATSDSSTDDVSVVDSGPAESSLPDSHAGVDSASHDSRIDSVATETSTDVVDSGISDPCPLTPGLDCSGECGGPVAACGPYECTSTTGPLPTLITSYSEFPFVIRTPDHPGTDPNCQPRCGAGNTVWGIGIRLALPYGDSNDIRIRVGDDWSINHFFETLPFCIDPIVKPALGCYRTPNTGRGEWFVATIDPNAPARNITIDLVPPVTPGGSCE